MSGLFPGSERLVQGEAPRQVLLLVGPPGCGKTTFIQQFLWDRLTKGEACLYVITDFSPEIAKRSMGFLAFDVYPYVERGALRIIDCYSGRAGLASTSPYAVENPGNLTEVSIMIEKARRGLAGACLALDSITSLALDAGLSPTRRFLQVMLARMRQAGYLGLCALELGIHDETFVNFLRSLFDGVLEMRLEDTATGEFSRLLRIFSLRMARYTTAWAKIKMVERGILVSPV